VNHIQALNTTRPLFVGQAPGRVAKRGARAFSGRVGSSARLAKLAGTTVDGFLSRAETVNVLKAWPGKSGKGDAFPRPAARRGVNEILRSEAFKRSTRVVFVGQAVWRAFLGPMVMRPCEWSSVFLRGHCPDVAYLPHPSGVNRWYNEPENRDRASAFLKEALDV